jgi:dipeptidyl aminopeptidase/acylaminoacyl peptidase
MARWLAAISLVLLADLAVAAPATALAPIERGIVYSKVTARETSQGEGEFGPEKGGLFVIRQRRRRQLTGEPGDLDPDVSRDGSEVAFVRNGDVFVIGLDGSGLRQLTQGPELDEHPLFAPDGRSLVFTRRADEGAPRDLYLVALDGTPPRPLTASPEDELEADFSLDGGAIVFQRKLVPSAAVNGDLFAIRADGSGLRRLTQTPAQEFAPHYFAGGILFDRRRLDGTPDVYTMRRNGSRVRLSVARQPGARIGAVSADGRLLVFSSHGLWTKRLAAHRSFPARNLKVGVGGIRYMVLSPDHRKVAFLFYFDEQYSLSSVDLRSGEFNIEGEVYNADDRPVWTRIDPRIAW